MVKLAKINIKLKFVIVSIIPAVILISMTVLPIITLYKGTEINVLVNAYYSSDSIRGKNLYIDYKFENVPYDKLPDSIKSLDKNSSFNRVDGYVVLKQDGDAYDLDYVSIEKPKDKLYLKCSIMPYYKGDLYDTDYAKDDNIDNHSIGADINCNLDRFFISEDVITKEMDKSKNNTEQWSYTAKIKIYNGYGILEDVKLK